MTALTESRLAELRFIEGIEKVEHVPYPTGDQFWVRFTKPLDLARFQGIIDKHNYRMLRFARIPSKLPRGLAEILWDGVTHVIVKKIGAWASFTSSLGFEPEGIAKIAVDLHGPYQIFMAMNEDGVEILYEYLGLKYAPPLPPPAPPKPVAPTKPGAPTIAKPTPPAGVQPVIHATPPARPAIAGQASNAAAMIQTPHTAPTPARATPESREDSAAEASR